MQVCFHKEMKQYIGVVKQCCNALMKQCNDEAPSEVVNNFYSIVVPYTSFDLVTGCVTFIVWKLPKNVSGV